MRHFLRKFTTAMAAAAVVLTGLTAQAAPSNVPEDKACSLTVTMKESGTETAASGESIAIYQVGFEGSENGNYHFYYTSDAFAESYSAVSGDQIPDGVVTSAESAAAFAQATSELDPDAQAQTDANGKVSFTNLPHGLYLVVQQKASDRYLSFAPFLVSLPAYNSKTESYEYDVSASPKVQKEVNRYTPATGDPGVLKRVLGDGAPSSQTFRMVFHRLDQSYPMMEGSTGDIKTLDVSADNSVHKFGTLTFTKVGDYYYEIYEDRTNAAENFTYDASIYRLEYQVRAVGKALSVQRVIIRRNDAEGVVIYDGNDTAQHVVITNTYKAPGSGGGGGNNGGGGGGSEEPSVTPPKANTESVHDASVQGVSRDQSTESTVGTEDPGAGTSGTVSGSEREESVLGANRLPQTGQLWWPVWLMAGAGSLLILLGLYNRRKAKA